MANYKNADCLRYSTVNLFDTMLDADDICPRWCIYRCSRALDGSLATDPMACPIYRARNL